MFVDETSVIVPSPDRQTSADRPRSVGRNSSQYISSPSSAIWPNPTVASAISFAVIGDFQLPYGAICSFVRDVESGLLKVGSRFV